MANLRVRIKNVKDLDKMLPKLKRSLSVQHNVELEDDGNGQGVFVLVVKEALQLKQFAAIKAMLDSYGFEFYLRTVDLDGQDYDPEQEEQAAPALATQQEVFEGCDCETCKAMRLQQQQEITRIREKIKPTKPVRIDVGGRNRGLKVSKKQHQERIAKELMEAVMQMKKALAAKNG